MYVDSHCHIDRYPRPTEVLDAAELARVVTVAVTETPSAFQALTVKAGRRPMLRVAVGLHPMRAARISRHELMLFTRMLQRTDYVGEVGLDFSPQGRPTRARQVEIFEHILAEPDIHAKILTVHSRGAKGDTIRLLIDAHAHAILHWYSGALKHLDAALGAGMWFSVNTSMLSSRNGQRILAALPPERVVTETDGSYTRQLGRPNDPSTVPALVAALAALWNEDPELTRARLFDNMARLYRTATAGIKHAPEGEPALRERQPTIETSLKDVTGRLRHVRPAEGRARQEAWF